MISQTQELKLPHLGEEATVVKLPLSLSQDKQHNASGLDCTSKESRELPLPQSTAPLTTPRWL